jgi:3-phytase
VLAPSQNARADEHATAAERAVRPLSSAADPAIWLDPADPARSTLIGQRGGSVGVYDLPGNPIQSLRQASLQVDLRDGFVLDGRAETIAAVSGGRAQALRFFRVEPASRGLAPLETWSAPPEAIVGWCLYVSPNTHQQFVFALSPTGTLTQLRVEAVQGRLELLSLRSFAVGEKATVCAADDELGVVYVAAGKRILRFDAEASVPADLDQAAARALTSSKTVLGLALYRASDGTGYLLASQGKDEIAVYRREGDNEPVTTLSVSPDGSGRSSPAIAGIDVTSSPLGSALPQGALVAQDRDQLRVLPWGQLASSARPSLKIDESASRHVGEAPESAAPSSTENGAIRGLAQAPGAATAGEDDLRPLYRGTTVDTLSSPGFSYLDGPGDPDYLAFVAAASVLAGDTVGAALIFRDTTEALRKTVGDVGVALKEAAESGRPQITAAARNWRRAAYDAIQIVSRRRLGGLAPHGQAKPSAAAAASSASSGEANFWSVAPEWPNTAWAGISRVELRFDDQVYQTQAGSKA